MTTLDDIFDNGLQDILDQRDLGNVRIQSHPEFEHLLIANYTEQAAFNREWNTVTRTCRGLIWNDDTFEVLARPFEKFFNFDEKEAPRILDDQVVWHWQDKADGSLGIVYRTPYGDLSIATRGSFASEQARMGQSILNDLPPEELESLHVYIDNGYTPLFEIVGPDNRIVLKYEENKLVPLGFVHIETGAYMPAVAARSRTMRDLLGDLSRSNAEGWVVWLSNRKVVKIKQADYVELHRVVTNLSEKEVWRQLRAGTYNDFKLALPDEWWEWAEGVANELRDQFTRMHNVATTQYLLIRNFQHVTLEPWSRKEQAEYINTKVKPEFRGLIFSLLDGRDISDAIWRSLEPKGATL